jgi:predicted nucleic acid-binding protein
MKALVLDASVVLKWFLPDEDFAETALHVLKEYVEGTLELMAPTLLPFELLNGLLVAERRGRISAKVTNGAFAAFLDLDIPLNDPCKGYAEVLPLARTYQRSVYDAAYLTIAVQEGIDFVTGDKRLFNAVEGKLEWVKWIGHI